MKYTPEGPGSRRGAETTTTFSISFLCILSNYCYYFFSSNKGAVKSKRQPLRTASQRFPDSIDFRAAGTPEIKN